MSTEQSAHVGSDESGLVPPQHADRPEWPKRLRSLTADELDRLTIDRDGRFYWDGKPVNYHVKSPAGTTEAMPDNKPADQDMAREAIDMLDRAAADLAGKKSAEDKPEHDGTPDAESLSAYVSPGDDTPAEVTSDAEPEPQVPAKPGTDVAPLATPRAIEAARPREFAGRTSNERMRLKLSPMQSLAMLIATIALFAGALGIAANGFVAANDWGCRVGWIKNYCPPKEMLHPGLSARIAD